MAVRRDHFSASGFWAGVLLAGVLTPAVAVQASPDPRAATLAGIAAVCGPAPDDLHDLARRIPGSRALDEQPIEYRGEVIGWHRDLDLADGGRLTLKRMAPRGRLRNVSVTYYEPASASVRPLLFAAAGTDCQVRSGRRLLYAAGQVAAVAIEHLDPGLRPTGVREPLNPDVPAGADSAGVVVAMVDSGVNYLLPEISARLARDADGRILGYDFWDLDARPFDANPSRSPFFPQRHGTKTASLLLREAPRARLMPIRYPRSDMTRMRSVVDRIAAHGVVIANLSLGSGHLEDWQSFERAARAHPEILFVVSAGNNGRDIDARPVYPAAMPLGNILTVTSSERTGYLARGSNRGRRSVDLMAPAERVAVTGFDGDPARASGSSYAAVRISALAARLLARHPDWRAPQLRAAILARAFQPVDGRSADSQAGFIPDPERAEGRSPAPPETSLQAVRQAPLRRAGGHGERGTPAGYELRPAFAFFSRTAWNRGKLGALADEAAEILAPCGISWRATAIYRLEGPETYRYFTRATAQALLTELTLPRPAIIFVRDTLQREAYEAEAIGKGNTGGREELADTVWMIETVRDPGVALAHELVHVLSDSGEHTQQSGNLMAAETSPENVGLSGAQCAAMVAKGAHAGLLRRIPASPR